MKFENFKKVIETIQAHDKWINSAYDIGIDLINVSDHLSIVSKGLFTEIYGETGEDLIGWWLYENVDKKLYSSKTKKVVADLTELKDLWKYIEKKNYKKG